MLAILLGIVVASALVGAVFHIAGWGAPLYAVTNFLARWVARALILMVTAGVVLVIARS